MKETRGSENSKTDGKWRNIKVNISVHHEVWKDSLEPKRQGEIRSDLRHRQYLKRPNLTRGIKELCGFYSIKGRTSANV